MQKVIVFGRGSFYQSAKNAIHTKYEVAAFLDNKVKQGQKEYLEDLGIYAFNPNDNDRAGKYSIVIMVKKFWDIYMQLLSMGINEECILFGIELFPDTELEKEIFSGNEHLISKNGRLVFKTLDGDIILNSQEEYDRCIKNYGNKKYRDKYPYIDLIANMPVFPANRTFGSNRGKPIDRYYIEKFLDENKQFIYGDTLEIAETTYSLKYGGDKISNAYMMHVMGWGQNAIKGNLETGEGIIEERFDALIITQTLMFIYELQSVAENIWKSLKYGGTALITVAGISQISRYDADNWGIYYGFYEDALRKLFEPLFGQENVVVKSYGNVKTAIAMLYGLCCEDLKESDFEVYDRDYPVIVTALLHKK